MMRFAYTRWFWNIVLMQVSILSAALGIKTGVMYFGGILVA